MCYSVVGTCSLLVRTQSLYVLPLDALLRRGRLTARRLDELLRRRREFLAFDSPGSMRYFVAGTLLLFK